jgi:hypothetical protein
MCATFLGGAHAESPADPACSGAPSAGDLEKAVLANVAKAAFEAIPVTDILPGGGTAEVIVRTPFDARTSYRGYAINGRTKEDTAPSFVLPAKDIVARSLSSGHPLLEKRRVEANNTHLLVHLPAHVGDFWEEGRIFLVGCEGPAVKVVAHVAAPISRRLWCAILTIAILATLYLLIVRWVSWQKGSSYRACLSPVRLTAGSDGRGSLSKLQVSFFSFVVFGLMTYLLMRTGLLSDLSATVLTLLGISGVGATVAKATEVSKKRLSFDNWAWLVRKGWWPKEGLAANRKAEWKDLVTTDGEFDPYRFQMFIFSLVVAGALIKAGLTDLASFTIPEALLGILGLSQVVYVGGKMAAPPSHAELDAAITDLRKKEDDFGSKVMQTPDPKTQSLAPPTTEEDAKKRGGEDLFRAYSDRAKEVRDMFESVTGITVDEARLSPRVIARQP